MMQCIGTANVNTIVKFCPAIGLNKILLYGCLEWPKNGGFYALHGSYR